MSHKLNYSKFEEYMLHYYNNTLYKAKHIRRVNNLILDKGILRILFFKASIRKIN